MIQPGATPAPRATVSALASRRTLPRLFVLTWDNSKTKTRDPRKNDKQEAFGTVYPNGLVSLDNGSMFAMMVELDHLLSLKGRYDIVYLDEAEQEKEGGQ